MTANQRRMAQLMRERAGSGEVSADEATQLRDAARELSDARTERLAAFITANPPAWAVQAAGPVPEDPVARLQWQACIAPVAAYRELFGWDNPGDPIGPEPVSARLRPEATSPGDADRKAEQEAGQ